MLQFESELWAQGYLRIAGVDEAGRGPLAGPVVAAAAILPQGWRLEGLDDSKKIADEARREELAATIQREAVAWAVARAEVEEIDALNIRRASLLAMRRAVEALGGGAGLRAGGLPSASPSVPLPQQGIIKGDARSLSIAAASVLAKTARDRWMRELDARLPGLWAGRAQGLPHGGARGGTADEGACCPSTAAASGRCARCSRRSTPSSPCRATSSRDRGEG
jgi:ribonuclease HII